MSSRPPTGGGSLWTSQAIRDPRVEFADKSDLTADVDIPDRTPVFVGTYSHIFRGYCRGHEVAIKVIRVVTNVLSSMRRKVGREREIWGHLDHPNIVPLYGYTDPSRLFGDFGAFISPWYKLGDAGSFFKPTWQGVITGVTYLHTYIPVIVHGDLKPGNILIDDEGNPRICDFGLCSIFIEDGHSGMTTTTEHAGTERYLAPELITSSDARPTSASDVYALGCIGLDFLFLQHPYGNLKSNRNGMITLEILKGTPPALRPPYLNREIGILWDALEACWEWTPTMRIPASTLLTQGKSSGMRAGYSLSDGEKRETFITSDDSVMLPKLDPPTVVSQDVSNGVVVDAALVEALKSSKDILYVLKLGESMENLIGQGKLYAKVELRPASSYQHLLVHRCADFYHLTQESSRFSITVIVTPDSHIPPRRIADLVPPEEALLPGSQIMHRVDHSKTASQAKSVDGNLRDDGDESNRSQDSGSKRKHMTIEEREAAYKKARARIFMDFDEKDASTSYTGALSPAVSTVSSTGGTNTDDGDESNRSQDSGSKRKHMTIEEREAAYHKARSRNFMDFDEKDASTSFTGALSSAPSTVSSTGGTKGTSSVDRDDASTAPTESEYSAPVGRGKDSWYAGPYNSNNGRGIQNNGMTLAGTTLRSTAPPFTSPNVALPRPKGTFHHLPSIPYTNTHFDMTSPHPQQVPPNGVPTGDYPPYPHPTIHPYYVPYFYPMQYPQPVASQPPHSQPNYVPPDAQPSLLVQYPDRGPIKNDQKGCISVHETLIDLHR